MPRRVAGDEVTPTKCWRLQDGMEKGDHFHPEARARSTNGGGGHSRLSHAGQLFQKFHLKAIARSSLEETQSTREVIEYEGARS